MAERPGVAARAPGHSSPLPPGAAKWAAAGGLVRLHVAALRDVPALLVEAAGGVVASRSVDFGIVQAAAGEPAGAAGGGGDVGGDAAGGAGAAPARPELLRAACGLGGGGARRGARLRCRSVAVCNTGPAPVHVLNVSLVSAGP